MDLNPGPSECRGESYNYIICTLEKYMILSKDGLFSVITLVLCYGVIFLFLFLFKTVKTNNHCGPLVHLQLIVGHLF